MKILLLRISLFLFLIIPFASSGINSIDTISTRRDSLGVGIFAEYQYLVSNTTVKHGNYKLLYNGKVMREGPYSNGKRNGTWTFNSYDGYIVCTGDYKAGEKHGEWFHYYANGEPASASYYNEGKHVGDWIAYHSNGKVAAKRSYENEKLKESVTYYENGNKRYAAAFRNGLEEGLVSLWFEDGTIESETYYKNGLRDSLHRSFNKKGEIESAIFYRNGNVVNVLAYNDANGASLDPGTIKDGNGTFKTYNEKGKLIREITYSNGMPNGAAKNFFTDGAISWEGNYSDRYLSGTTREYSEGKLRSEIPYEKGNRQGKAIWYYESGKISKEGAYENGYREGVWKEYGTEGDLTREYTYRAGDLHGPFKYYNEGRLYHEGDYANDKKTAARYYNRKGKEISAEDFYYDKDSPRIHEPVIAWDEKKKADVGHTSEMAYTVVQQMPVAPGGEIVKFIRQGVRYPKKAVDARIQGTVYIEFVVEKTGEVTEVEVIRGVIPDLDEVALNVIRNIPNWVPGMQSGWPVRVRFTIPVKFTIK